MDNRISDERIEVITQGESVNVGCWLFFLQLAFIAIASAVMWKLFDKTDAGMYVGAGVGFVLCMLSEKFREVFFGAAFGLAIMYGIIVLMAWVFGH